MFETSLSELASQFKPISDFLFLEMQIRNFSFWLVHYLQNYVIVLIPTQSLDFGVQKSCILGSSKKAILGWVHLKIACHVRLHAC